jgi:acetyl-CoA carboxylase biotin carboxylase subunit
LKKLLVANRGEIAVRVLRACHGLGLQSVAVFSDADAAAPHVRLADEAVRIGAPAAAESYLHIERILEAARKTGADAVHPGYGFLAENANFAQACADAGLTFVGPPPDAIAKMGSKTKARGLARAAGVPVIPGYDGDDQADEAFVAAARDIGFPVLVKASAGGGGRGMRIVRDPADLEDALASCRREAKSAFADGTLLLERYIEKPRHVEIQILGEASGRVLHLFERECSIQRRHQKIIEESPSPALDEDLRARMGGAAVTLAEAIGYTNAGTVEFILDPEGSFYFLEVNTRLQVEHPVTELVTGVDIVQAQLRIAAGEPIPFAAEDLRLKGNAIECRLYAEDPSRGFLPSTGRLLDWHVAEEEGARIDSGVERGLEVSPHYDSMLAKLVTWGPNRLLAISRMERTLRGLSVLGVQTNRELLLRILSTEAFRAGETDTHFIDTHLGEDLAAPPDPALLRRAARAATLYSFEQRRRSRALLPGLEPGYRNNPYRDSTVSFEAGGEALDVAYSNLGDGRLEVKQEEASGAVKLSSLQPPGMCFEDTDGVQRRVRVVCDHDRHHIHMGDASVVLRELPRLPEPEREEIRGGLVAPVTGQVARIAVSPGDVVKKGQVVAVIEAMKMEHALLAPEDGTVAEVLAAEGETVQTEAVLVVLE